MLHFPWYDAGTQRLYAAELNAFIGRDYLITLPNVPLKPISALFRRYEKDDEERQEHFAKGAGYVFYEVLDAMYAYCFPILDSIGRKLDDIEDALSTRASRSSRRSRTRSRRSSPTARS